MGLCKKEHSFVESSKSGGSKLVLFCVVCGKVVESKSHRRHLNGIRDTFGLPEMVEPREADEILRKYEGATC